MKELHEKIYDNILELDDIFDLQQKYDTGIISSNARNLYDDDTIDNRYFTYADRDEYIVLERKQLEKDLQRILTKWEPQNFGEELWQIYRVVGTWTELNDKGQVDFTSDEPSFLIVDISHTDLLKDALTELGTKYNQNSFYFKKQGDKSAYWYRTHGSTGFIPGTNIQNDPKYKLKLLGEPQIRKLQDILNGVQTYNNGKKINQSTTGKIQKDKDGNLIADEDQVAFSNYVPGVGIDEFDTDIDNYGEKNMKKALLPKHTILNASTLRKIFNQVLKESLLKTN